MVAIVWEDAHFDFDDPFEYPQEYLMTTIGYVIERGPKWVRIAGEHGPDGYRAVTHIPVNAVKDCKTLMAVNQ